MHSRLLRSLSVTAAACAGLLLTGCAQDRGPVSIFDGAAGSGELVGPKPVEADYAVFEHLRRNVFRQDDDRAIFERLVRLADAPDAVMRGYVARVLGRGHPLAESLGVEVHEALHALSEDVDPEVQRSLVRALAPLDTVSSRALLGGIARRDLPARVGVEYLDVVEEARDAVADRVPDKDVQRFRTLSPAAARAWVQAAPSGVGDSFRMIETESGRLMQEQVGPVRLRMSVSDVGQELGAYYSEATVTLSVVEQRDGAKDRGPSRYVAHSPFGFITSSGEYGWLEIYVRHLGEDRVRLWLRRRQLSAGRIQ